MAVEYYLVRDICKWKEGPTTIRSGKYETMEEALDIAQKNRVSYDDILKADWTEISGYSIQIEEHYSDESFITIGVMDGGR